ncbi:MULTISPECIES: hypothetical protein [Comamonas]|jgi:hypothetical protein|uniref:hypothetical protein n=1 Tax=Comamonas TaxID=283 RepID=UPI0025FF15AA|nr:MULTISPECIES: hypothetical protein [Comamonas]MDR3067476.1 hypothetical protein [Comamonas sp.]MEB5965814.1 hypothetical protein [Comamonas testosteroni]
MHSLDQRQVMRALLALALLSGASFSKASNVMPPPLPPGSAQIRMDVGAAPEERKRNERAHHHKGHFKKDYTRDDSLDELPTKPGNPSPGSPPKDKPGPGGPFRGQQQ